MFFPSLSFPVNRLSRSSSVGLCNFLIIPTALQVGDLVRKRDLRCVSLSLLCRFTNPLKHFCFASDRPTYSYMIVVCSCIIIQMSPENEILSSYLDSMIIVVKLILLFATNIVPFIVVSKPCLIFQSRYSV